MSINSQNYEIENINISKVLEKFTITDKIINDINSILSLEAIDDIFSKLEKFKENWKRVYLKYWTDLEKKQFIIDYIFKNLSKLFNELNIKRIHNSTSSLSKDFESLSQEEQLKNFFHIKWGDLSYYNSKWASCNNWVILVKSLIESITEYDSDITYNFQINMKHNHWLMYITTWDKKYIFDSNARWLIFEEIWVWNTKEKAKYKPKHYDNVDDYKEEFRQNSLSKNVLTFDFWDKKLKIVKRYWMITVIFRSWPLKYVKVNWLKRVTKIFWKLPTLKYVGKVPLVHNIDQINDFIVSKVKMEEKEDISNILWKIHDEKLLQFFNLSKV